MRYNNATEAIETAGELLKSFGKVCRPKKWQAIDVNIGMWEIFNLNMSIPIPTEKWSWAEDVKPSLPWADDHFIERVSGKPLNPPPSYKDWPHYRNDEDWRRVDGKFSHSYPERMWAPQDIMGIRYRYGNLRDLIDLMRDDPHTRQAFLPIWFPEDTGAHHGERVPCTIGYWFIHRGDKLDMYYPIRSCDYRRHFRNDIYMAGRLVQWMLYQLQMEDKYWDKVLPGDLNMQVWNLHVFEGEQNFI